MLKRVNADQVAAVVAEPFEPAFLDEVRAILDAVRTEGDGALRRFGQRFDGLQADAPLVLGPSALAEARDRLAAGPRQALERTAGRIRAFAQAQRSALQDVDVTVEGGRAGHRVQPVARAGCYAPGGRYPLPSSVLMTAVVARTAGVPEVWVASPKPTDATLAAACIAEADGVLVVGGAPAVAAFAYGTDSVPATDVIVGPGNRWTTAAKQLVSGTLGIDMLAGPSELLVVADASADPKVVAQDLLAQAEHDPDARVGLVTLQDSLLDRVDSALAELMADLPTAEVARTSIERHGYAVVVDSLDQAAAVSDRVAPEHLQLHLTDAGHAASKFRVYGGLFVGQGAAEALGDYGIGPNHTLPTAGTARHRGGLSVYDFVSVRTWLWIGDPAQASGPVEDAITLARMEGLEAHARSAALRRKG